MPVQFTLGKNERLKSRKLIDRLFKEGKRSTVSPFRIHYIISKDALGYLKFGVGVSNKNFKRAVDRNRIKRLTREAWRLQKQELKIKCGETGSLSVFLIFTGKDLPDFQLIKASVQTIITKLIKTVEAY